MLKNMFVLWVSCFGTILYASGSKDTLLIHDGRLGISPLVAISSRAFKGSSERQNTLHVSGKSIYCFSSSNALILSPSIAFIFANSDYHSMNYGLGIGYRRYLMPIALIYPYFGIEGTFWKSGHKTDPKTNLENIKVEVGAEYFLNQFVALEPYMFCKYEETTYTPDYNTITNEFVLGLRALFFITE